MRFTCVFLLSAACLLSATARGQENKDNEFSPELARQLGQLLDRDWKGDRPEWAEMMVLLLKGEGMGMNKGWFRPSQSRYSWNWLAKEFDENLDGKIDLDELPEGERRSLYLARLDRNRNGQLTLSDFQQRRFTRDEQVAGFFFSRLDVDSNGRISTEEFADFFDNADSGSLGFLTPDDLQGALSAPQQSATASTASRQQQEPPTPAYWLNLLVRGELGSLSSGPKVSDEAPDFTLKTFDGKSEISLASFKGDKPVVLIFGSFT